MLGPGFCPGPIYEVRAVIWSLYVLFFSIRVTFEVKTKKLLLLKKPVNSSCANTLIWRLDEITEPFLIWIKFYAVFQKDKKLNQKMKRFDLCSLTNKISTQKIVFNLIPPSHLFWAPKFEEYTFVRISLTIDSNGINLNYWFC